MSLLDIPTRTKPPKTYGTAEEGTWVIGSNFENDWGWGPFPTKTKAVEFIEQVDRTGHMYAVNLTENPKFFNLAPGR